MGVSFNMQRISRGRFDVIAGYARKPQVTLLARELDWFELPSPHLLGAVVIDTDGEFSGIVFAPDMSERFRWVSQTSFWPTRAQAESELEQCIAAIARDYERVRAQGDEPPPMSFFAPTAPEARLHPTFSALANGPIHSAAKRVIEYMMRWYRDQDGNFVEQFQTAGFDARLWELYLFATLIEAGYTIKQPNPAPDLKAIGVAGSFCVEATTINPSQDGSTTPKPTSESSENEIAAYLQHYLPIRFAGPLTTKLSKRYWEHPEAAGLPLAFAIQDFHDELSMTYSGTALSVYLYGKVVDVSSGSVETPVVSVIAEHRWGTKVVDSGFFSFPGAENVSAVLFNSAGTLSKFNRIGVATGFGSPEVTLVHKGYRYGGEPPARERFATEVGVGYSERWIHGMNVFHNPEAKHRFDPELLPGAAHHFWLGDRFESWIPDSHLESSQTLIVRLVS